MLRSLRKYSNSTPVKILYGLLAALFVLWGVGTVGGEREDVVAKVQGTVITRREVDLTAANLQRQYEEMLKGRFAGDLFRTLDLHGRALDQLIDDALLRDEAERLGLTVTDDDVTEAITKMPQFQENGRFDRNLVRRYLEFSRDRGELESQLRKSILFGRLQGLVTDGVQVSAGEIDDRYRLDHEQVRLGYVRFAAGELAKTIAPGDDDLEKYLAAHPEAFRRPARVRVRYVAYRPADFAAQVTVSDGEVAERYVLEKDERFLDPEQVRARHILVGVPAGADEGAKARTRKKAEELAAKAKGGADFAALARKNSGDKATAAAGGDLGFFPRGRMSPAFESVAFALPVGQVSDVVETPFGFHVIKVDERRDAGPRPLEAVRDQLLEEIRTQRAAKLARQQAEDDRRNVVRGGSFAEALAGRLVEETPLFAAGDEVPGVGRVPPFSEAAFALGTGQVSDLIETEGATPTVYLLTPVEHLEPEVPPLAEVRDRILADVRRERGQAAAKERAEALLARAKEVGLEKAAAEQGLRVEETPLFERRASAIPNLPGTPDLAADAFTLSAAAPLAPKVYAAGGDAVVAALRERVPADMTKIAEAKSSIEDSMLQQKRQAVLSTYMTQLKERAQREGALEVRTDALPRG